MGSPCPFSCCIPFILSVYYYFIFLPNYARTVCINRKKIVLISQKRLNISEPTCLFGPRHFQYSDFKLLDRAKKCNQIRSLHHHLTRAVSRQLYINTTTCTIQHFVSLRYVLRVPITGEEWHAYGINFNHVLLTSKVHIGFVLFCFSDMFFNV